MNVDLDHARFVYDDASRRWSVPRDDNDPQTSQLKDYRAWAIKLLEQALLQRIESSRQQYLELVYARCTAMRHYADLPVDVRTSLNIETPVLPPIPVQGQEVFVAVKQVLNFKFSSEFGSLTNTEIKELNREMSRQDSGIAPFGWHQPGCEVLPRSVSIPLKLVSLPDGLLEKEMLRAN